MVITPKSLMMLTDLSLIFLFKTIHTRTQNIKHTFIYTRVYLYYLGMCDSGENIQFGVQLIRAYAI